MKVTYYTVATTTGAAAHLSAVPEGNTLCGRTIANRGIPFAAPMCTRCERAALIYMPLTDPDPEPETPPRCPAHGKERCICCSRIGAAYLVEEPEDGPAPGCCGCDYWGETGMHWDTCPCRIHGEVLIHPMFREDECPPS
jgi:hypothetical protein